MEGSGIDGQPQIGGRGPDFGGWKVIGIERDDFHRVEPHLPAPVQQGQVLIDEGFPE